MAAGSVWRLCSRQAAQCTPMLETAPHGCTSHQSCRHGGSARAAPSAAHAEAARLHAATAGVRPRQLALIRCAARSLASLVCITLHICLPASKSMSRETTHQEAVMLTLADCLGAADPSHFQDAEQQFLQLLRTPDLDKTFRWLPSMRCFPACTVAAGRGRPGSAPATSGHPLMLDTANVCSATGWTRRCSRLPRHWRLLLMRPSALHMPPRSRHRQVRLHCQHI